MVSQGKHLPCQVLAAATRAEGWTLSSVPSCSLSPGKQPQSQGSGLGTRLEIHKQLTHPKDNFSYKYPKELSKTKQVFRSKAEASIFRSTEHPHTPTKDHRKHWVGRGNKQNKTIHLPTQNSLPADFHICKKSTHTNRNNLWCWILLNSKYLNTLKISGMFGNSQVTLGKKKTNTTTKTKQI